MERDEVVREDFPSARKGWDPDAVRAHLETLAERIAAAPPTIAETASEQVAAIVSAAEEAASRIEAEARAEADKRLEEARREGAAIVARARREAEERVARAQSGVESLVSQAEGLRSSVGSPGGPSTADPSDAVAAAGGEETPRPDENREAPAEREPEQSGAGTAADEGPSAEADDAVAAEPATGSGHPSGGGDGADRGAARLVAMNLALEGAEREEIVSRLGADFGELEGADELADEVLERAGRS